MFFTVRVLAFYLFGERALSDTKYMTTIILTINPSSSIVRSNGMNFISSRARGRKGRKGFFKKSRNQKGGSLFSAVFSCLITRRSLASNSSNSCAMYFMVLVYLYCYLCGEGDFGFTAQPRLQGLILLFRD